MFLVLAEFSSIFLFADKVTSTSGVQGKLTSVDFQFTNGMPPDSFGFLAFRAQVFFLSLPHLSISPFYDIDSCKDAFDF